VEVDEFMCGKDGRVMEEVSKREVRDVYGFWGGGLCVDIDRPAVEVASRVAAVTAAASLAVTLSALLKVF